MKNLNYEEVKKVFLDIVHENEVRSIRECARYLDLSQTKIRDIYGYLAKFHLIYSIYRKGYYLNPIFEEIFLDKRIEKIIDISDDNFIYYQTPYNLSLKFNRAYLNPNFSPNDIVDILLKIIQIDLEYGLYKKYKFEENQLSVTKYGIFDAEIVSEVIYKITDNLEWCL